jgi:bacterioferritin-associated ferredoxin
VSSKKILKAIAAGATTVEEVGMRCGAGTRCGRCHETIELLLQEAAGGRDGGQRPGH